MGPKPIQRSVESKQDWRGRVGPGVESRPDRVGASDMIRSIKRRKVLRAIRVPESALDRFYKGGRKKHCCDVDPQQMNGSMVD